MSDVQVMDSGIHNIYLHHSVFPSVTTKLPCHTHTNLTGENGAGKSTMLSLIPIFYGIEPNKMVATAGDKLNFVGHYLPNNKSMIVFEYVRLNTHCCAVLYRSGQQVEYRFVEGKADDVLFSGDLLEELSRSVDVNQWLMNTVSQFTMVSRQIKTSKDYRAVIQNNKRLLREKRKRNDSLLSIAAAFSLCDPAYEMKHIEAISSVLMKKDHLLKRFKTMVVDAFLVDQIEMSSSPYHKQDGEFIDNLRSLIELDKHNKDFDALLEKYDALKGLWSRIRLFRRLVSERLTEVSESLITVNKQYIENKEQRDSVLTGFDSRIMELNTLASEVKGHLKTVTRQIENLFNEKDEWDDVRNIAHKQSEYERRDDLREAAEEAESYYKDLMGSVVSEKDAHEAKLNAVRLAHGKKRTKLGEDKRELTNKIHSLQVALSNEVQRRNGESQKEVDQFREQRTQEAEELRSRLEALRLKQQALGTLTSEEIAHLDGLQRDIDLLTERMEEKDEQAQAVGDDKQLLEDQFSEKRSHRNRLSNRLNELIAQRESIMRQLEPDEQELRAYLNKNVPGWHQTFGKVLRPELLTMKHLKPAVNDDSQTVFGISLELDGIELPDAAQTAEILQQRLEETEKDIGNTEAELGELSRIIEGKESEVATLKSTINRLSREKEELLKSRHQLKLTLTQEKEKIQRQKEADIAKVGVEIESAEKSLSDFTRRTNESIAEMREMHEGAIQEYRASQTIKEGELRESIDKIDALVEDNKKSESAQVTELKQLFKSLLDNKGISPTAESDARERRDASKQRYKSALGYRDDVQAYASWEKNIWAELPALESREVELKKKLMTSENDVETEVRKKKVYESESLQKVAALRSQRDSLEDQVGTLKGISDSLNTDEVSIPLDHPEEQEYTETIPLDVLVSQASESLVEMKHTVASIRTVVRKVDSILLNTDSRNKVNEFWSNIKREIVESGTEEHSEAFLLECAKGVHTLVYDIIPDVRRLTIEHIRTIGEGYVRFYHTLGGLSRKVKSVSGMLGKEINTKNNFPDLQEVNVELVSKVEEYAIWRELSVFNREWERWMGEDRYALPNESFLGAFQNAIDGMKAGGVEGLSSKNALNKIEPLVDIHISLVENDRRVVVKNDQDLAGSSSEGLSRLAIIIVFTGATRYLSSDPLVKIHWPVDEIGTLDHKNTALLFEFMEQQNINLFCAQPNQDQVLRKHFPIKCKVSRGKGIIRFRPASARRQNVLLEAAE